MFVKGHQRPAAIYSELKLAQLLPFLLCSDSFLWTLEGRTLLAQLSPPPPLPLLPTPSLPEVCSLFIVQDTTAIQLLGSRPTLAQWSSILSQIFWDPGEPFCGNTPPKLRGYPSLFPPGQRPAENPVEYSVSKANRCLATRAIPFLGWRTGGQTVSLAVFFSRHSDQQHGPWSILGMWKQLSPVEAAIPGSRHSWAL